VRYRVVLDLCAGSGAWSAPYREAGYTVIAVDLPTDVRLMPLPDVPVHGILAAPPCTMFCRMRMCRGRPSDAQFLEALSVVDACLRLVAICRPRWWALENPQGYLSRWLGAPALKFDPWEYGDPWTKRTWLWGEFSKPLPVVAERSSKAWIHRKRGSRGVATQDSENPRTPPGFARAFMEVNP
jgi:hypothetical protein